MVSHSIQGKLFNLGEVRGILTMKPKINYIKINFPFCYSLEVLQVIICCGKAFVCAMYGALSCSGTDLGSFIGPFNEIFEVAKKGWTCMYYFSSRDIQQYF
ncbi:hypothetical protein CLV59_111169 [Chitinophaga dinghuensis]|uniref:Uncharacterized protein n=1 Tax=Chitinophaga dinghuensis TaxID=1539050 RepID=A0A327VML8_9BACT|nr:hypothetical protein CLV59_111169 [Chitinophaga dinghuensis]